jgi:hypothetical protein
MRDRIVNFFTSLRLTVACLAFGLVLVFVGTLAQVDEGLYNAQARYFKSWFIWAPTLLGHKVPIALPGGYLLGTVLLVNLLVAHAKRFKFEAKKTGIIMVHAGVILLLLGQLLTDVLSSESAMKIYLNETKSYSEDFHRNELVVVDQSDASSDEVVSIPESLLAKGGEIRHEKLPLTLRVKNYWPNASFSSKPASGATAIEVTDGIGRGAYVKPEPPVTDSESRNLPAAVVEVLSPSGSQGTWLVSTRHNPQTVSLQNKACQIGFRFQRHYKPFSITLLDLKHDIYKGTDIPKNFSSRIRLQNPATGEDREHLIFMNNPLRYNGETYYQYQMAAEELARKAGEPQSSTFQVVRNPSWLTPYFSCVLVGLGLVVQFMTHLVGFAMKRRAA